MNLGDVKVGDKVTVLNSRGEIDHFDEVTQSGKLFIVSGSGFKWKRRTGYRWGGLDYYGDHIIPHEYNHYRRRDSEREEYARIRLANKLKNEIHFRDFSLLQLTKIAEIAGVKTENEEES